MDNRHTLFSMRLKKARLRLGISQRRLGIDSGFDVSNAGAQMNQYETGRHTPRYDTVVKIAKALGVPTSYLYEDDSTIANIILDLGDLSAKDRKTIAARVASLSKKDSD